MPQNYCGPIFVCDGCWCPRLQTLGLETWCSRRELKQQIRYSMKLNWIFMFETLDIKPIFLAINGSLTSKKSGISTTCNGGFCKVWSTFEFCIQVKRFEVGCVSVCLQRYKVIFIPIYVVTFYFIFRWLCVSAGS